MIFTLSGIVIDFSWKHDKKAPKPISTILLGIFTEDKLIQPQKASHPIFVTEKFITL